jgi:hypothetical protein
MASGATSGSPAFLKRLRAALRADAERQVERDLKVAVLMALELGAFELERKLGITRQERLASEERLRRAGAVLG